MKTVKLIAVSSLLLVGALCAKAQDFATGYFLGGYQYAYRMNPAFWPVRRQHPERFRLF